MKLLCKDCKHFRLTVMSDAACDSPCNKREPDPVMGYAGPIGDCYMLRHQIDLCGPAAKWFEPKDAA